MRAGITAVWNPAGAVRTRHASWDSFVQNLASLLGGLDAAATHEVIEDLDPDISESLIDGEEREPLIEPPSDEPVVMEPQLGLLADIAGRFEIPLNATMDDVFDNALARSSFGGIQVDGRPAASDGGNDIVEIEDDLWWAYRTDAPSPGNIPVAMAIWSGRFRFGWSTDGALEIVDIASGRLHRLLAPLPLGGQAGQGREQGERA